MKKPTKSEIAKVKKALHELENDYIPFATKTLIKLAMVMGAGIGLLMGLILFAGWAVLNAEEFRIFYLFALAAVTTLNMYHIVQIWRTGMGTADKIIVHLVQLKCYRDQCKAILKEVT